MPVPDTPPRHPMRADIVGALGRLQLQTAQAMVEPRQLAARTELLAAGAGGVRVLNLVDAASPTPSPRTNIETVLGMLVLADRHGALKLKDVCVKFLVDNCHTVVLQSGWKEMLQPYPSLLAGKSQEILFKILTKKYS